MKIYRTTRTAQIHSSPREWIILEADSLTPGKTRIVTDAGAYATQAEAEVVVAKLMSRVSV